MSYNTIEKIGKGEYKSRGSKFFSFSHPISSIDDYRHLIAIYRKNFPESCHVCSAYRLLVGTRVDEQASDDGEPRGSAGQPILNQLKRNSLINVATYVVRIFGGSLLGIPGLIEAYSGSALLSIDDSKHIPWKTVKLLSICFAYDCEGIVASTLNEFGGKVCKKDFSDKIYMEANLDESAVDIFMQKLKESSSNKIKIVII